MGGTMNNFYTIHAGILYRGEIRNFLNRKIFQGFSIEYIEQKNFLDSTFCIKGEELDQITPTLEKWIEACKSEDSQSCR
jgi:hypothetical protein